MTTEHEECHHEGQDHRPGHDDHHGHDHCGDDGPKGVTIFVNTRPHDVPKGEISYEELVTLAYPNSPPGSNVGYTVTYQRGHGNHDGDLVAGQVVKVKDGMIFDVTATVLS